MDTRDEKLTSRLQDLARRVTAWKESAGKSDAWLVRKFDMLGSPRTLRDMRDGKTENYNLEVQLANYEAAWSLIESEDPAARAMGVITTLTSVVQLKRAVLETMLSSGNDRVILLLGDSGIGKTCALKALAAEYDTVIVIEALEVWNDAPGAMLASLLEALGEQASPMTMAYALFQQAVRRLCKRRVTLCIDEAHHMGKSCLNTVKGLINATPGEFVLSGQPTLWAKLQQSYNMELRQITTNRLRERLTLTLNISDVSSYVAGIFPDITKAECQSAAKLIVDKAVNLGNMSFVRDVCTAAARKSEDPKHPLDAEFAKAVVSTAAKK